MQLASVPKLLTCSGTIVDEPNYPDTSVIG